MQQETASAGAPVTVPAIAIAVVQELVPDWAAETVAVVMAAGAPVTQGVAIVRTANASKEWGFMNSTWPSRIIPGGFSGFGAQIHSAHKHIL